MISGWMPTIAYVCPHANALVMGMLLARLMDMSPPPAVCPE